MLLSDADERGFLASAARCDDGDSAQLVIRTEYSRVAICSMPSGALYYRGARNSDGLGIHLNHVEQYGSSYTAINDDDGTNYQVSRAGLRIVKGGQEISSEQVLESAP